MYSWRVILAVVAVIVVAVGAAYSLNLGNTASNRVEVHIMIVGDGTDYYSPANISVREGQAVTLAVFNDDDNSHGLVLPAFKVDTGMIQGSTTVRVTFVADVIGTFQFYSPPSYCLGGIGNVCNSKQDLNGTLTVNP